MNKFFQPNKVSWNRLTQRATQSYEALEPLVQQVFDSVRQKGDEALLTYTQQFDGVKLNKIQVDKADIENAASRLPMPLQAAIQQAYQNIYAFHKAQKTPKVLLETQPGVLCWQEKKPIDKVGLYIPGGSAPLFSTLLMLAIPAKLAGCRALVLCTPPNKNGEIADAILYAAKICGVEQIFKVGGIQAIGAMTFGTATIPQVYKIFGPGNQFVTVAKQQATRYGVAIDMPAGPSELLVAADHTANPIFVASDLLSQAEHGPDSQVILVSTSKKLIDEVAFEIEKQILELPRKEIAEMAIKNSSLIYFETDEQVIDFVNEYGPEHYIIAVKNEDKYVSEIRNAGSVFVGHFTPESAGDYASGTNHTLPTNGYAKQYSGVHLDSFMKAITFQKISKEGLQTIGPIIECMADAEGLQAHKNAVTLRLKENL